MFPEVETLPRAEGECAAFKWDAEIHGGECGAHVGRHVVVAFGGVLEDGVAVRREPREEAFEVAADFGISVFLN